MTAEEKAKCNNLMAGTRTLWGLFFQVHKGLKHTSPFSDTDIDALVVFTRVVSRKLKIKNGRDRIYGVWLHEL